MTLDDADRALDALGDTPRAEPATWRAWESPGVRPSFDELDVLLAALAGSADVAVRSVAPRSASVPAPASDADWHSAHPSLAPASSPPTSVAPASAADAGEELPFSMPPEDLATPVPPAMEAAVGPISSLPPSLAPAPMPTDVSALAAPPSELELSISLDDAGATVPPSSPPITAASEAPPEVPLVLPFSMPPDELAESSPSDVVDEPPHVLAVAMPSLPAFVAAPLATELAAATLAPGLDEHAGATLAPDGPPPSLLPDEAPSATLVPEGAMTLPPFVRDSEAPPLLDPAKIDVPIELPRGLVDLRVDGALGFSVPPDDTATMPPARPPAAAAPVVLTAPRRANDLFAPAPPLAVSLSPAAAPMPPTPRPPERASLPVIEVDLTEDEEENTPAFAAPDRLESLAPELLVSEPPAPETDEPVIELRTPAKVDLSAFRDYADDDSGDGTLVAMSDDLDLDALEAALARELPPAPLEAESTRRSSIPAPEPAPRQALTFSDATPVVDVPESAPEFFEDRDATMVASDIDLDRALAERDAMLANQPAASTLDDELDDLLIGPSIVPPAESAPTEDSSAEAMDADLGEFELVIDESADAGPPADAGPEASAGMDFEDEATTMHPSAPPPQAFVVAPTDDAEAMRPSFATSPTQPPLDADRGTQPEASEPTRDSAPSEETGKKKGFFRKIFGK